MKAVLISIQPRWCELIAIGQKSLEVRKNRPKLETPFKCYIYQTRRKWRYKLLEPFRSFAWVQTVINGQMRVIGEFVCDEIKRCHFGSLEKEIVCAMAVGNVDAEWYKGSCISYMDAYSYLRTAKKAYAWHISDLKIYDRPKGLHDFSKPQEDCHREHQKYDCPGCWDCMIKRPPQSWCYVEAL